MYIWAVEFSIDYPPAIFRLDDDFPSDALVIGTSDAQYGYGGIAIAWFNPQNAFDAFLALRVRVAWTSNCSCGGPGVDTRAVSVRGYNYAHAPIGGQANPRVVRWPDFAEIEGAGVTSLVCPSGWAPVPTQQTTWGALKALYR